MSGKEIRIATYNIHKGVSAFGIRSRIHALKTAITELDADILFLQEVQGRHDLHAVRHAARWPEQAQHEYLAGESHHAAYGMNAIYDHGHHGNALLSRFQIESQANQDVSDHAYESRGILHCKVQVDGQAVHCYVVHLGLFGRSRQRQTAALVEAVRSSSEPDDPIIIAGDFNDWGDRLGELLRARLKVCEIFENSVQPKTLRTVVRKLLGRQPVLKPARTFPSSLPVFRLDRIYIRGFDVRHAEVRHGLSWARLSDHAPIVASLALRPR